MVLIKFSNDQNLRIVALYREQECLWRTDLVSYRDKDARYAALDHIRIHMMIPSLTVEDVKKKIKYLRSTYKGEVNKIEKSRRRGDIPIYSPSLAWFHQMDCFIKDVETGGHAGPFIESVSTDCLDPALLGTDDSQSDFLCEDVLCVDSPPPPSDPLQTHTGFRKFSKEETMRFIALYKDQECLWNTESPDYKNRDVRADALEYIRDNVNMTNLTINDIKKKIKYLRATYMCELNKIEKSLTNDSGRIHKPCLAWFNEMHSFIKDLAPPPKRKPKNSVGQTVKIEFLDLNDAEEEMKEDLLLEQLEQSTSCDSASDRSLKRPRVSQPGSDERSDERFDERSDERFDERSDERSDERPDEHAVSADVSRDQFLDEYDIFARHVAVQLRALSLEEAVKAQEAIQSVLTRFRLNQIRSDRQT